MFLHFSAWSDFFFTKNLVYRIGCAVLFTLFFRGTGLMRLLVFCLFFAVAVFKVPLLASEPIEILCINVRLSTANDKENSWSNRKELLLSVLKERNYDFIGGQEVIISPSDAHNQIKYLSDNLPEYGVLFLCREKNPNRGEGTPVFYRKDRWLCDEQEQGTYWLSDTPDEPGSVTWEGQSNCPRVVTGGLFHEINAQGEKTGKSLYVYSTHFDHVGEIPRQKSAALIMERIAARKQQTVPVVLIGDLNCGEKSPSVRSLKGETVVLGGEEKIPNLKFLDTFRVVHPDEQNIATFHGFRGPSYDESGKMRGYKIDYIFVTPDIQVKEAEIIRAHKEGRYPSDHYPVRAVIGF